MKIEDIVKRHPWATDPAAYSRHARCMRARRRDTLDAWICFAAIQTGAVCVGIALAAYVGAMA